LGVYAAGATHQGDALMRAFEMRESFRWGALFLHSRRWGVNTKQPPFGEPGTAFVIQERRGVRTENNFTDGTFKAINQETEA
jgi:hypothetical protein